MKEVLCLIAVTTEESGPYQRKAATRVVVVRCSPLGERSCAEKILVSRRRENDVHSLVKTNLVAVVR